MNKIDIIKALLVEDNPTTEQNKPLSRELITGTEVQIVILQRGWVTIGRYSENGDECTLTDAKIIRTWGTTKGLGEIAEEGTKPSTKLDDCPTLRFHKMTVIARMDVNEKNWSKLF